MVRLIRWLITGDSHLHEWDVYNTYTVTKKDINYEAEGYILRCKHCGKMKTFELDT